MDTNQSIKSSLNYEDLLVTTEQAANVGRIYQEFVRRLAATSVPGLDFQFEFRMKVTPATPAPPLGAGRLEEMPSAIIDASASNPCTCDVCGQVQRPEQGDSSIIEGLCSRCTLVYYDALKDFSEDAAFAALHSQDAIRLLVLRLRVGRFDDAEDIKGLLNEHATEVLERLPASFAPWWRDAWNWTKSCEMKAARKAVGWTLTALNAPPLQRLAAMFAAEQDKVKEIEARHQRELEEAWESGAMEGVQDTEDVMKDKIEEMEAEHKKQMAAITEASAEASCAVGEAAEKIRHDAKRRGYADGYAFADQKATKVIQALRADLEAARKEGENHQAGYIRLIGERDEAVLEVVDLRQEIDASAEANEKLEAQVEALEAAAAANYQAGYSAAEEKFRAEFQELRKCRADATDVFQAMRADLERLSAENQALRQKAEEDKQMVQRHLKEVAQAHAAATAWEKEEIERLRKDVRAHEARVAWHADMAKRDMEAKGAEIKKLEAQVADHSRWRDEADWAASVAQLEAKKLRANLAETDWDKEHLVKAVEALRELVGPTQKLMQSNPEMFGGEARGASSPRPPPIIRLKEEVSEEGKQRALNFLKSLVDPSRTCQLVESSPSVLPGIVEAEPSTEGMCMALTEAQYEEMFGADRPSPLPPIVPDEPKVCGTAGCIDCPLAAEPVAGVQPEPVAGAQKPIPVCCVDCGKPKPDYNHPNWPSPITKRFAKHLAKHSGKTDPKTIKTHQDALEFIAKRANVSVETLLKWTINHYQSFSEPWTLVQGGSHHFHMGTGSATWWC